MPTRGASAGPSTLLDPGAPLTRLAGIGPTTAERLAAAGLHTIADLVQWFPRRYKALRELDRLSELERDVVLLRVVGELSSDEVARVVGKTPGNVRVIQARALGRIRDQLKKKSVTNPIPERLLS